VNTVAECTVPEKILLAAHQLEEQGQSPFSAEALIVAAWQKFPKTFGLKGYTDQHPDSNKVLSCIMGERGLARRGWLSKMGQKLYALTNWSAETFPSARRRFAFLSWFEGIVVSGDEGLIKPDPALFRRLFARYAIEPSHAVFIDDDPGNARAAASLGVHGIAFGSAAGLRAELQQLRLL